MMDALQQVEALGLPDCWIGAGFIRNAVWDALHSLPWQEPQSDIDVIYFDATATDRGLDCRYEALLRRSRPALLWSVKNQAAMHLKNADPPYCDTADAMRFWPERCTAIAVRVSQGQLDLLAPFGIDDLMSLRVRPTPNFISRMPVYQQRLATKKWRARWPRLCIED
ncbi:hypothetical protein VZ95_11725 [Elstera litoralis]|uniref:Nitrate reductase n=2 Tax=Elstera litoralis TaxID=552518 RepID=A0A0F3IRM5_9PROT|nr:hypothetical protein VZ95_11725 [Elstera litoralis]